MATTHSHSHSTSSSISGGTTASAVQAAMDRVRGEVEKLVENAVSQGEKALDAVGIKPPPRRASFPAADVTDSAEAVVVRLDLPGVRPGGVSVDLSGSILIISGTLPAFPPPPGATAVLAERPHGAFSRAVSLPAEVDPDAVAAELRDGLLTVTLKKNVAAQAHSIPVNPGPPVNPAPAA